MDRGTIRPGNPEDADQAFWSGYLRPGETLLWSGRPSGRSAVQALTSGLEDDRNRVRFTVGLTLAGMALFGAIGQTFFSALPWLGLMALALFVAVRPLIQDQRIWRGTRYAVTSDRALIWRESSTGSPYIQSWAVSDLSSPSAVSGGLYFAWKGDIRWSLSEDESLVRTLPERVGFHFIPDAPKVQKLIETLQRGAA